MNFDELYEQIKRDEESDAPLMTPVAYARYRGIYPQRVYQKIRNKKLETVWCPCGRKCIDPKVADAVFGFVVENGDGFGAARLDNEPSTGDQVS